MSKKTFLIIRIIVYVLIGATIYLFFFPNNIIKNFQYLTTPKDINRVKDILEDIRQGWLSGNIGLVEKYDSKLTIALNGFNSRGIMKANSFKVDRVFKSGQNIVAVRTIIHSLPLGADTDSMVFIEENGDWKYDSCASAQWKLNQGNIKNSYSKENDANQQALTSFLAGCIKKIAIISNGSKKVFVQFKTAATRKQIDSIITHYHLQWDDGSPYIYPFEVFGAVKIPAGDKQKWLEILKKEPLVVEVEQIDNAELN